MGFRASGWSYRSAKQRQIAPTSRGLSKIAEFKALFEAWGRSPAQVALGWNLARSERTIPIPGFKTVEQVEDNSSVLRLGPLSTEEMQAVAGVVAV